MGNKIKIGKIVNTQGLRGELKIYPLTDYIERFEEIDYVYLEGEQNIKLIIEAIRFKKNLIIVKFRDLNNIDAVEKYKDKSIFIDEKQLRELPDDSYYIFDLIGIEVYDENNNYIGILKDVIQNAAQDTYVIENNNDEQAKNFMIPAVREFIKNIDIENKKMIVKLIEGMIT